MKSKFILILAVLLVIGTTGAIFAQTAGPNLIKNGDFSKHPTAWPALPNDWNFRWSDGDGYEPIKTEDGRFIGWAEKPYSFALLQNITNPAAGTYTLSAYFRLNPDSNVVNNGKVTMSVFSGRTLIKQRVIHTELLAMPREKDHFFDLKDIPITGGVIRIEFEGVNISKYIGIDNVVFSRNP